MVAIAPQNDPEKAYDCPSALRAVRLFVSYVCGVHKRKGYILVCLQDG